MPIDGLSEKYRTPRAGKIRLGATRTNDEGKKVAFPLDYFLVREDDGITSKTAVQKFQEVYGEKPTLIDVMFPCEDPAVFFPHYYTCYNGKCKSCEGDGKKAERLTGEGQKRNKIEVACPGEKCEYFKAKQGPVCRPLGRLQLILPKVKGLGVWEIDTTGKYSIENINSIIRYLRQITGQIQIRDLSEARVSFIPFKLCLKKIKVSGPKGKLETIRVVDIAPEEMSYDEIMEALKIPPLQILLPDLQDDPKPAELYADVYQEAEGGDVNNINTSVKDEKTEQSSLSEQSSSDSPDSPVQSVSPAQNAETTQPDEQELIKQEIAQTAAELGIEIDLARKLAKEHRLGKIDTREKLNAFTQILRAYAAQQKPISPEEPPAPLLSDEEKKKMSQEIARVVSELGLEQQEVVQLVEAFGTIDSYARHDAFLQALRDRAAQKAQGAQGNPPDFEKQAIQVAAGLDIPEQVVKDIIRNQFDTLSSQETFDALVVMLNDLHEENLTKARKTTEKPAAKAEQVVQAPPVGPARLAPGAAATPPTVKDKPAEAVPAPDKIEDPAQVIGYFFQQKLTPFIKEAQKQGIKCSFVIVAETAGYKDPDDLRKALTSRAQVDELFQRVREKLGLTAA